MLDFPPELHKAQTIIEMSFKVKELLLNPPSIIAYNLVFKIFLFYLFGCNEGGVMVKSHAIRPISSAS